MLKGILASHLEQLATKFPILAILQKIRCYNPASSSTMGIDFVTHWHFHGILSNPIFKFKLWYAIKLFEVICY